MFLHGTLCYHGNIAQMVHQILVETKDRDRFLWRNNYVHPIEHYRMNVHLFSKVDSPCIANWTIKKTAADQSDSFDQISIKTIESDFNMGDFLSSFHKISVAVKVCVDVINILQKGGLRLTKFISNNRSLLQALPTSNISPKLTEINLSVKDIPIERALGVLWNPETDTFHIKYTLKSVLTTKRGILSLISSIFDPLGFITPALIEPKWIIQQLWKRKIDWDELLPSDLTKCWQKWLDNLPDIQNITLDRWYGSTNTDTELHVFADASKIAYGVACYIRFKVNKRPKCSFIMSKSKLAPVNKKSKSIP